MANLYRLNRDYEEILSGLSFEEIVTFYRNLNKKMLETYPSLNSNKWNVEEHNKIFNSVEEATDVFKTKYPLINLVNYATKFEELQDKYLDEHDLAVYKLLTSKIVTLTTSINFLVNSILAELTSIYNYYDYSIHIGTSILKEELNVPEELLEPLEPYFYNKDNSSFYGATAINSSNRSINTNFKVIEFYIESFNDFKRIKFNPEDVTEDLAEVLTMYNKAYDSGKEAIDKFEELKKEPFKLAVKISVEVAEKMDKKANERAVELLGSEAYIINRDYEALYKSTLASAPKYNFETFELILPNAEEGVVN